MSIYRGPGGSGDATNDATSQSLIATQAAIAADLSASQASTSALNASNSATDASDSAAEAATYASNSSNYADDAADYATAAASALDEFTDLYLGAKTTNPTVDNDGNTLQTGALYFNTVANEFRVWTGTYWQVIVIGAIGDSVILQAYSGDGVETEFTLSTEPFSENVVLVFINGAYQQKNTYSISGLTLTFSEAPPLGTDNIEVSIITMADLSSLTAGIINLEDSADYYESNTVEGALQEVGRKLSQTVSVKDFGAVGDGVTDDWAAIKAAVDYVNQVGGTLYFPPGHYKSPRLPVDEISSWIVIDKNDVTLKAASRGSVTLENIMILVRGSYGNKFRVSSTVTSGQKTITTASPNNFTKRSYIQLLSSTNPYSPDAGEWQGGSTNPSTNIRPECIFAETHKVNSIINNVSFSIHDEVLFPVYFPDNTGLDNPVTGLDGAYVREVFPVENCVIDGFRFVRSGGTSSYRGIAFQRTVGGGVYNCDFVTDDGKAGFCIRTEEAVGFTLNGCTEFRSPEGASGSSWNSIIIGGGSQNINIDSNSFTGGQQIVDVTPAQDSVLLFGESRNHGPEGVFYVTCNNIKVTNNTFTGGTGNAFTSHPAVYKITLTGNQIEGGTTGIGLRSRGNVVVGNNIRTLQVGIDFSSFYDQTVVSSNRIQQMFGESITYWTGISISPLSSETMNNNATDGFVVSGNLISAIKKKVPVIRGFHIRHSNDGVPNSPSFTEFTNTIKTGLSNVVVSGNQFNNCGVSLERYVNGVSIVDNTFTGNLALNFVRLSTQDCVNHTITGNKFIGVSDESEPIRATTNVSITYPYLVRQRIFGNFSSGTFTEHTGAVYAGLSRERLLIRDGVTVSHEASVQAVRNSGTTSLHICGTPLDGVSRSNVWVNYNSGTDDNRLYNKGLFVCDGSIWPFQDDTYLFGTGSLRWSQIYAATGTINTSDEREKQQVFELSEAERAVALRLKNLIRHFKFNDAVSKKGEDARIHVGVIAQDVIAAFAAEGLDATRYALLCYDEWEDERDEDGNITIQAGNRYGIRYDELLAFVIGAM